MWAVEGEPEVAPDSEQVSATVRRITWAEAASFEQERTDELEPYGLDRPSFRILLSDGILHEELLVGDAVAAEKEEPARYARMASRPHVVTLPESLLDHLSASLEEVLEKDTE